MSHWLKPALSNTRQATQTTSTKLTQGIVLLGQSETLASLDSEQSTLYAKRARTYMTEVRDEIERYLTELEVYITNSTEQQSNGLV